MDIMLLDNKNESLAINNKIDYYGTKFFSSEDDKVIEKIVPLTIASTNVEDNYSLIYLCKSKSNKLFTLSCVIRLDKEEQEFAKNNVCFYDEPSLARLKVSYQFANTLLLDTIPGFLTSFIISSDDIESDKFSIEVLVTGEDNVKLSFNHNILGAIKYIEECICMKDNDEDILTSIYSGAGVFINGTVFKVNEIGDIVKLAKTDYNGTIINLNISNKSNESVYFIAELAVNNNGFDDSKFNATPDTIKYNDADAAIQYITSSFYQTTINGDTYIFALAINENNENITFVFNDSLFNSIADKIKAFNA